MQKSLAGGPFKEVAPFCRKAAADGAVLLMNEGGMLPVTKEDNIALFGRCQIDYYRSGTGSGGCVNVEYTSNLLGGLREYPWVQLNEKLVATYEDWIKEHPFDKGDNNFASEPWNQEEMPLSEEQVKEAAESSNKAIVIIGRTAGEEKDNQDAPGSYRLTEKEKNMLMLVTRYFSQVAVILNVSNIVDLTWTKEDWCKESLKAILYTWHGGIEGGNAAADLLAGAVSPSGHLADTIAYAIEDYPSFQNYGNPVRNFYEEDIYVGYRYFETFAPGKVMYPFGYGLSYTTFAWDVTQVEVTGEGADTGICMKAEVKNTGAYSGRAVLQMYVEAPQGKLGKPKKVLVNFAKTKVLAPGETEILTLATKVNRFASYDDGGITGNKSCYVLEAGAYRFHVGENSRDTKEILVEGQAPFVLKELLVAERLQQAAAPLQSFQRMKPVLQADGTYAVDYEAVPVRSIDLKKRILEKLPKELPATEKSDITFLDVKEGRASLEEFTAQLSLAELATIVRGEGMCNARVTSGTAAAFGGVSDELAKRGIPAACASDGPSGIRRDTGEKATQLPIGTLLACSFDTELVEELFYLEGQELYQNEIDTLLGPGMNIHRFPLNGRNFEYFSEDPYVSGMMAAACEKGMERAGVVGTLKHFACNNQEIARHVVDSVVSERALREIYLKGFEIAVKEGGARAVMTTYNPMNGYQNSCNYDLNTTILRGEWGFSGIVMTDWWAKLDDVIEGGSPNYTDTASMVRAQNDLYMTFNNNGAAINAKGDNTEQSVAEGKLTKAELQRSAMTILRFLLKSPAAGREVHVEEPVEFAPLSEQAAAQVEAAKAESIEGAIFIGNGRIEQEKVCIKVEKAGLYNVHVRLKSNANYMEQLLCQLYVNGEKGAAIQSTSTMGSYCVQRITRMKLYAGIYELYVEHIRPGIELDTIQFVEEV